MMKKFVPVLVFLSLLTAPADALVRPGSAAHSPAVAIGIDLRVVGDRREVAESVRAPVPLHPLAGLSAGEEVRLPLDRIEKAHLQFRWD